MQVSSIMDLCTIKMGNLPGKTAGFTKEDLNSMSHMEKEAFIYPKNNASFVANGITERTLR